MGRMGADTLGYTLEISEHLFRLTTESLRLRSNETRSYQTLESLVDARARDVSRIGERNMTTLKEHLVTIPTRGDIRIELCVSRTSAETLGQVCELLSKKLDANVTVGDAVSVLLFDYLVEQKAS
ncbi:MAG: hypothetical protein B7Z20_12100, partial [Sphingobium sp. 32-64-5]